MSVLKTIAEELERARGAVVHVGVLASRAAAPTKPGSISVVELAAIHEFGAPGAGIPERSFIRSTFREHAAAELQVNLRKLAKGIVSGKLTADRALNVLGAWGASAVKNSIVKRMIKQDLAPETIRRKNRTAKDKGDATTALVDTGRLLGAIAYEVIFGGAK